MIESTGHRVAISAAGVFLALPLSLFFYFAWRADAAMDKTGIGYLAACEAYQAKAGIAFWLAAAAWLSLLTIAVAEPSFRRTATSVCTIALVVSVVAWFGLHFA